MIASAYIADRMGEFQGSYVLGTAGYNAGPGRAREWMREFGDPRDPKVDAIDWIYRIPFEETREYVQKVLANTQIYRARLGAPETALRINDDLARARGGKQAGDQIRPDDVVGQPVQRTVVDRPQTPREQ
jgi:peptidoglycan lytic transglycosylase